MPRSIHRTLSALAAAGLALGLSACTGLPAGGDDTAAATAAPAAMSTPQDFCELGSCETATVDRVVDGDTVDVVVDGATERVRVLGIDTPETKHPDKPVGCMGPEAAARTSELAPAGDQVTLITDDNADSTDNYGRLLRHIVTADDTLLGDQLLGDGLATTTTFEHSLTGDYATSEDNARQAAAGLWGQC